MLRKDLDVSIESNFGVSSQCIRMCPLIKSQHNLGVNGFARFICHVCVSPRSVMVAWPTPATSEIHDHAPDLKLLSNQKVSLAMFLFYRCFSLHTDMKVLMFLINSPQFHAVLYHCWQPRRTRRPSLPQRVAPAISKPKDWKPSVRSSQLSAMFHIGVWREWQHILKCFVCMFYPYCFCLNHDIMTFFGSVLSFLYTHF